MAATSIIRPIRVDMRDVETVAGKFLTFRVASQEFAMNAACVRGILPLHDMVAPEILSHGTIRGFASIGGRDFPVVDLGAKLGLARGPRGREPFIVVVEAVKETEGRLLGFIADRISELVTLRARDFRDGVVKGHGRPRRVLNPDQILVKVSNSRYCPSTPPHP